MIEDPIKHLEIHSITTFLAKVIQEGTFSEYAEVYDLKIVTEELVCKHRTKYANEQTG